MGTKYISPSNIHPHYRNPRHGKNARSGPRQAILEVGSDGDGWVSSSASTRSRGVGASGGGGGGLGASVMAVPDGVGQRIAEVERGRGRRPVCLGGGKGYNVSGYKMTKDQGQSTSKAAQNVLHASFRRVALIVNAKINLRPVGATKAPLIAFFC